MKEDTYPEYGALVLRVALGLMFIAHALLKILVFTPAGAAGYFESLGLPGSVAYLTMAAEILGGLALVAGIATRWVSLGLLPILIGALILVHWGNGWMFANQGGGWEYPAFLIAASIAQAFLGDGAYSARTYLPILRPRS